MSPAFKRRIISLLVVGGVLSVWGPQVAYGAVSLLPDLELAGSSIKLVSTIPGNSLDQSWYVVARYLGWLMLVVAAMEVLAVVVVDVIIRLVQGLGVKAGALWSRVMSRYSKD